MKPSTVPKQSKEERLAGAAEGSFLGPELWNKSHDGILGLTLPDRCHLVGYADDIAIVITGRNKKGIQSKLSLAMIILRKWLHDHGLELAAEKTELIFLPENIKRLLTSESRQRKPRS